MCAEDSIRILVKGKRLSVPLFPAKPRHLIFNPREERAGNSPDYLLGTWHTRSHLTRWLPGVPRDPWGRLRLCWVTCFAPATADTHTAADSEPQQGSEDQGTSRSSLFNFGKTQCSLHSNVAKWCHDPLALGSPIQRATSHTALTLPTA